jgi:hypothetical protein
MSISYRRANITVSGGRVPVLTCRVCGEQWAPLRRRPMERGWWKCPNGCNAGSARLAADLVDPADRRGVAGRTGLWVVAKGVPSGR